MKFLPSKRIVAALIVCIAIIAGAFVAIHRAGKEVIEAKNNDVGLKMVQNTAADLDTDHDSLKDWEESLWGTDPKVADTDGDGMGDGEEVKAGRDPLTKGAGSQISSKTVTKTEESQIGDTKTLNNTERLSRTIFVKYLALKQSGQELTPEQEQAILDESIKELGLSFTYKTYTQSQISLSDNETSEMLRQYGENLGKIAREHQLAEPENELTILNRMLQADEPNPADATKLAMIAANYRAIIAAYLKISVPRSAAPLHLALINSMSKVATNIEGFSKVTDDAVLVLAHLSPYSVNLDVMTQALRNVAGYFKSKSIVFEPNSPGYAFTQLAQ